MAEQTQITRQAMEAAIRAGGSVMLGGRILTKLEELPTEADLAKTGQERDVALGNLLQQRKALDAQIEKLAAATPAAAPTASDAADGPHDAARTTAKASTPAHDKGKSDK